MLVRMPWLLLGVVLKWIRDARSVRAANRRLGLVVKAAVEGGCGWRLRMPGLLDAEGRLWGEVCGWWEGRSETYLEEHGRVDDWRCGWCGGDVEECRRSSRWEHVFWSGPDWMSYGRRLVEVEGHVGLEVWSGRWVWRAVRGRWVRNGNVGDWLREERVEGASDTDGAGSPASGR
jgi:hypothetical protein